MSVPAIRGFLARHWVFVLALLLGAALRVITMLGFPPAIWYGGDSVSYVNSGLTWYPGQSRESRGCSAVISRPRRALPCPRPGPSPVGARRNGRR